MKAFGDFGSFAEHLLKTALEEELAIRRAVGKSAKLVQKCAKDKIGEYQNQIGPFAGWQELDDSTKADRERKGYADDDPLLRTGGLRDSIEYTQSLDGLEAQVGSNSDIAVYQELGTKNMPPRSFLGGAMAEKLPEILKILGEGTVAALLGEKVVPGGIAIEE